LPSLSNPTPPRVACARRMTRSGHQWQEAVGVALTAKGPSPSICRLCHTWIFAKDLVLGLDTVLGLTRVPDPALTGLCPTAQNQ
jgi:hypothetical protein